MSGVQRARWACTACDALEDIQPHCACSALLGVTTDGPVHLHLPVPQDVSCVFSARGAQLCTLLTERCSTPCRSVLGSNTHDMRLDEYLFAGCMLPCLT